MSLHRNRQQSISAWVGFAAVAAVVCLFRPEMLGVFIGIAVIYLAIWLLTQFIP